MVKSKLPKYFVTHELLKPLMQSSTSVISCNSSILTLQMGVTKDSEPIYRQSINCERMAQTDMHWIIASQKLYSLLSFFPLKSLIYFFVQEHTTLRLHEHKMQLFHLMVNVESYWPSGHIKKNEQLLVDIHTSSIEDMKEVVHFS